MKIYKLGKRNLRSVSPVVATLILIIVAIVGAVSVGLIVSGIGTQTGRQSNAGQGSSVSSSQLLVQGSSSLYPSLVQLGNQFDNQNPGYQVEFAQGGSAAGLTGVINGLTDIGVTADYSSYQYAVAQFPSVNLQSAEIGASAEVVVEQGLTSTPGGYLSDGTTVCKAVTQAALKEIFTLGQFSLTAGACSNLNTLDYTGTQIVSGTTFKAFVGSDEASAQSAVEQYLGLSSLAGTQELSNTALINAVQNNPNSIAFVDLPWNINNGNAILAQPQIDTLTPTTSPTLNLDSGQSETNLQQYILRALTSSSNPQWPDSATKNLLTNHFYAVTKGPPDVVAQKFIQFIESSNSQPTFDAQGVFAVDEYNFVSNTSPLILFSADSYVSESSLLENSFTTSTGTIMAPPVGAGSGTLAANIRGGAPVSVFVSISKSAVGLSSTSGLGPYFPGWALAIATDQMVIAYSPVVTAGEQTVLNDYTAVQASNTSANWVNFYNDLTSGNVKVGIAAPDPDPAGYRGWMVLMLADKLFPSGADPVCTLPCTTYSQNLVGHPGQWAMNGIGGNWVPYYPYRLQQNGGNVSGIHAAAMVAPLETGNIQFLFMYRSLAISDGLNYITLTSGVNLGSGANSNYYSTITYITPNAASFKGALIQLYFSVPTDSTNPGGADSFVAFTAQNYQTVLANAGMQLLPKPVLYYNTGAVFPSQINQLVTAGVIILSTPAPPPNQLP